MILRLIAEAEKGGARLEAAADILDLNAHTIIRWRKEGNDDDRRKGPSLPPSNKLTQEERNKILDVANSVPYWDLSSKQIVPKLADQCTYIGSESTFYRVLKEQNMLNIANHQNQPRIKSPMNMPQKGLVRCGVEKSSPRRFSMLNPWNSVPC